jgi:hypothetical protein
MSSSVVVWLEFQGSCHDAQKFKSLNSGELFVCRSPAPVQKDDYRVKVGRFATVAALKRSAQVSAAQPKPSPLSSSA